MAEVFLAEQQSLGRQVALKVLDAKLAEDASYVQRFKQEARSAAALVHPNIIQIFEVGQVADRHFIAQEYVPGRNAGQLLEREGTLPPDLVLDILVQVGAALQRAHERSIIHRDIKPDNLMLSDSGEVKVADFGLARAPQSQGTQLTQVGVTLGTPLYMSPEQIEGRSLDIRSDLYSLGVSAYHMLTGEPPFTGEDALAVAVQHLNRKPKSLAASVPTATPRLCALIEKLLEKKPEDRFATPAEMLEALQGESTLAASQRSSELSPTERLGKVMQQASGKSGTASSNKSRSLYTGLAAGVACIAGLFFASLVAQPRLLADAQRSVLEKETVRSQLLHAKLTNTAEAWRMVSDRFPDADPFYQRLADQGLARQLFESGNLAEAFPLFQRLADANEAAAEIQRFGLAGVIICLVEQDDLKTAQDRLAQFPLGEVPRLVETEPALGRAFQQAMRKMNIASSNE